MRIHYEMYKTIDVRVSKRGWKEVEVLKRKREAVKRSAKSKQWMEGANRRRRQRNGGLIVKCTLNETGR